MSIESTATRPARSPVHISPEKNFVPALLPWVVGAAGLLVYLATLNHWNSFRSLDNVAMVSGWMWQPELGRPLYWLVTYPFRFLPGSLIPLALNLFSAVCGALTLSLLARSVALLPHDRTEEQRLREPSPFALLSIRAAWLPPVFAVLVCGFQLTFWENATSASSDIFDLLLFAYIIRCLLEFRLYGSDSWLLRAAFVYGASMTNNWAMIAFFPIFIAAVIWTKGIGFFNLRFLRQMFFLGSAGLCFYLLLPAVSTASVPELGFWQALKQNLGTQKGLFFYFLNKPVLFQIDRPLWIMGLYSLLPILAIAFRSPAFFGDPSKLGVWLANSIFQLLNGALLLLCAWVALDPQFSPRNYAGVSALPLYYLGALSIGYFTGFFLLVFGGAQPLLRGRPIAGYPTPINALITGIVWVLPVITVALLLHRNIPQMRITNGPFLRQYAELLAAKVPNHHAAVLSDDPSRLYLLDAIWAQKRVDHTAFLLDTHSLISPIYHRFLNKTYAKKWGYTPDRKQAFENFELQRLVLSLSTSNSIHYLHPSFGYYFEEFYPQAHGLSYKLDAYPTNSIARPPMTAEVIAENQSFWQQLNNASLDKVVKASAVERRGKAHGLLDKLSERLYLFKDANLEAENVASYYSRALNSWGVQLQRDGKLPEAEVWLNRAHDLYPENVAAEVNYQCNRQLQAGQKSLIQHTRSIDERLGKYRTVQILLNFNGPVDESTLCYQLGHEFYEGRNFRQAAHEFNRVAFLAPENSPENLSSRLFFANACLNKGLPDDALKAIQAIKAESQSLGVSQTNAADLLRLEAFAYLFKNDSESAQRVVQATLDKYPDDEGLLSVAAGFYLEFGPQSNALKTIDKQLVLRPDNTSAMVNKGLAWIRLKSYTNAISPLTEVIELGPAASGETNIYYAALYNRGLAYWKSDKLDKAQKDYEILQKAFPGSQDLAYALGELGYAMKETNAAIRNYRLYLSSTPPTNAPETSNALTRLQELQRSRP